MLASASMYVEGYAARDFSDIIVTEIQSPEAMARRIVAAVRAIT